MFNLLHMHKTFMPMYCHIQDIGHTALMDACFKGHTECVELLLSHHADPNIRSDVGRCSISISAAC